MSDEQDFEPIDPAFLQRVTEVSDEDAESRARALRAGLDDYDLESEDFDVLEGEWLDSDEPILLPALPVLAIVGRPNVGKSAVDGSQTLRVSTSRLPFRPRSRSKWPTPCSS